VYDSFVWYFFVFFSTFAFVITNSNKRYDKLISDVFAQRYALVLVHDTTGPCIYFYLKALYDLAEFVSYEMEMITRTTFPKHDIIVTYSAVYVA